MRLAILVRAIFVLLCIPLAGCLRMGQASDDDKQQLAAWSQVVTDKDRAEVQRQANTHTDWMEKKKVEWMTQQYRTRYNKAQAKKAATQATTKPTTVPTSLPATQKP